MDRLRRHFFACFVCSACPAALAHDSVSLTGTWINGAEGFQMSGLTSDNRGALWSVGDQNSVTTELGRSYLGKITLSSSGVSVERRNVYRNMRPFKSDFEGIFYDSSSDEFLLVSEEFFSNDRRPFLVSVRVSEEAWLSSSTLIKFPKSVGFLDTNERLEGIARVGNKTFLALEGASSILELDSESDLGLTSIAVDLRDYVSGVNALSILEHDGSQFLLALSRNSLALVLIQLPSDEESQTYRVSRMIDLEFMSPDQPDRKICWPSPEGMVVQDDILYIVSDPAYNSKDEIHYREIDQLEAVSGCDERSYRHTNRGEKFRNKTPILFSASINDFLGSCQLQVD